MNIKGFLPTLPQRCNYRNPTIFACLLPARRESRWIFVRVFPSITPHTTGHEASLILHHFIQNRDENLRCSVRSHSCVPNQSWGNSLNLDVVFLPWPPAPGHHQIQVNLPPKCFPSVSLLHLPSLYTVARQIFQKTNLITSISPKLPCQNKSFLSVIKYQVPTT